MSTRVTIALVTPLVAVTAGVLLLAIALLVLIGNSDLYPAALFAVWASLFSSPFVVWATLRVLSKWRVEAGDVRWQALAAGAILPWLPLPILVDYFPSREATIWLGTILVSIAGGFGATWCRDSSGSRNDRGDRAKILDL